MGYKQALFGFSAKIVWIYLEYSVRFTKCGWSSGEWGPLGPILAAVVEKSGKKSNPLLN
jgi:hypothetical protein